MMKYLQRLWCAILNKRCDVCLCGENILWKKPAKRGRPKKK